MRLGGEKQQGRIVLISLFFIVTLFYFHGVSNAADKTIKWKCQSSIAPASPTYKESVVRVADLIKEQTNGKLIIEHYSAGALLPNDQIFPAVKRGMIEMGFSTPSYWKSDLPLALCNALPLAFTDYWQVLYFYEVLGYQKMLRDHVAKHDVLYFEDHVIPVEIVTKEAIRTLEELKGKKIRTYGQFGKFFSALGAQPVSAPGPEIYTGLATGVFQGAHWGAAVGAESLGLYEVCKFHMKPSISLGTEEAWFINKKAFDALPKDIQEVVTKVLNNQFWIRSVEYAFNEEVALAKAKAKGVQVITLPPEDQKKMAQAAVQVWDEISQASPDNAKAISMLKQFLRDIGRL